MACFFHVFVSMWQIGTICYPGPVLREYIADWMQCNHLAINVCPLNKVLVFATVGSDSSDTSDNIVKRNIQRNKKCFLCLLSVRYYVAGKQ